jgi:hypothetical protein
MLVHRRRRRIPLLLGGTLAMLLALAACTEVADPSADTMVIVDSEVPTTMLNVGFLDVFGFSYCQVVDEVAGDIRVYADPASDFGDPSTTRDAYVGALRAFDAIAQVAPPQIKVQADLMRRTLDDSVKAALDAGWDLTAINAVSGGGSDPAKVAAALASLRSYSIEQCAIDIVETSDPASGSPNESPQDRIRRVLSDLFPDLDDAKLRCLEPRLPLDFDPASEYFDPAELTRAFAGCRIDFNDPSAPTSVAPAPFSGPRPTTPTVTTVPSGSEIESPTATDPSQES